MRIATLILGLMLGGIFFLQALLGNVLASAADSANQTEATSIGIVMAAMWLLASALVIAAPRVAGLLFILSAALGFGFAASYPDLTVWSSIALVLALFAYLGYREKRTAQRKQDVRDAQMEHLLASRS